MKWAINLYLIALGAAFSLASFLLGNFPPPPNKPPRLLLLGYASGTIVFIIGWLLLSFLSHRLATNILLFKHINVFRHRRLEVIGKSEEFAPGYVFPLDPEQVETYTPGLLHQMPYIFFTINYCVLVGTTYFYSSMCFEFFVSASHALTYGAIFGILYPRSCIVFKKHIWCALHANTLAQKKQLEKQYESLSNKQRCFRLIGRCLTLFWLVPMAFYSIYATVATLEILNPVLKFSNFAFYILIPGALFAIMKYCTEVFSSASGFKKTIGNYIRDQFGFLFSKTTNKPKT